MNRITVPVRKLIGAREYVSLPEFGLDGIEAKIDTGADSSALHCHDIRTGTDAAGRYLAFQLLDPEHPAYQDREFKTRTFTRARVKNTSGTIEKRYRIRTTLVIGTRRFKTSLLLADRAGMSCPMLLGRRLLKNRYFVDVSHTFITSDHLKRSL